MHQLHKSGISSDDPEEGRHGQPYIGQPVPGAERCTSGAHMMPLAVSLLASQINAAGRLHLRLKQWHLSDAALKRLADRCPGFDSEAALLKVVAINGLYGTNVYALVRMAEHIRNTLLGTNLDHVGPEIVEQIARLPDTVGQKTSRRHISFAAKFAHFFLNADRFPIMDSYAVAMVRHHLGRRNYVKVKTGVYLEFVENIQRLIQLSAIDCTSRELDRYLWLAGLYRRWQKQEDSKINREASTLFADDSSEVARDLQLLVGNDT